MSLKESFETLRTHKTRHSGIPDARNFASKTAALKVGPAPMKNRPLFHASSRDRSDHEESVISIAKNGAEKRQSIRSQNLTPAYVPHHTTTATVAVRSENLTPTHDPYLTTKASVAVRSHNPAPHRPITKMSPLRSQNLTPCISYIYYMLSVRCQNLTPNCVQVSGLQT